VRDVPDERDERVRWIRAALDRHEGALVAYAARIAGDLHAARDVVQEAFLRLCREDRARVEGRVAAWLYTVCRRLAIDERRRVKRAAPADAMGLDAFPAPSPRAEPAAESRDETRSALEALAALPEAQQEVILLKFRHGLTYREIAEVTGLSEGHVGVRIHEGMTALRRRFRVEARPARAVSEPLRAAVNEGGLR
jgi:RNA polymerase sigma-70 factor (ECF subfamily)